MSPRMWRVGAALAAVIMLVVAWFLVLSPKRQQVAELNASTVDQRQAADQLRGRISLLKKMGEEVPAQEAKLAAIQQRMPTTMALPSLIRQLSSVASQAGVQLAGITPARPSDVSSTVPVDHGSSTPGAAGAAGGQATTPTRPAATGEASPTVSTTQLRAATVSITVCGSFAQLRTYLQGIESMRRVVAVSAVDITRGACTAAGGEDDLTAALTAHAFTVAAGGASPEGADE